MDEEKSARGHLFRRDCFPEVFLNASVDSPVSNANGMAKTVNLRSEKQITRKRKNKLRLGSLLPRS